MIICVRRRGSACVFFFQHIYVYKCSSSGTPIVLKINRVQIWVRTRACGREENVTCGGGRTTTAYYTRLPVPTARRPSIPPPRSHVSVADCVRLFHGVPRATAVLNNNIYTRICVSVCSMCARVWACVWVKVHLNIYKYISGVPTYAAISDGRSRRRSVFVAALCITPTRRTYNWYARYVHFSSFKVNDLETDRLFFSFYQSIHVIQRIIINTRYISGGRYYIVCRYA